MIKKTTLTALAITTALATSQAALSVQYEFESAGPNVVDNTGNGGYLEPTGSPAIETSGAPVGSGFTSFDNTSTGNDAYWRTNRSTNDSGFTTGTDFTGTNARTFAFWVKADSTQYSSPTTGVTLFSYGADGAGGAGKRFELLIPTSGGSGLTLNDLRVEVNGNGAGGGDIEPIPTNFADGSWHHIAVTLPGGGSLGDVELFVNGTFISTVGAGSDPSIDTLDSQLYIGRSISASDRGFSGGIDEFRIYDTVLTSSEISSLAAVPEPATYALFAGFLCLGLVMVRRRLNS